MTHYTVTLKFFSEATREQVAEWADQYLPTFPEDSVDITIERGSLTLDAEELTDMHVGHMVRFDSGKQRVEGKLDAVYRAGLGQEATVLVVEDVAWTLRYGVVQVTDW